MRKLRFFDPVMALWIIALSTKNLQILDGWIPAGCIWLYVVDLKISYLLWMGLSFAHHAAKDAGIRISLIDLFSQFVWNIFTCPTSYTSFRIQHMFGTFSLPRMNCWLATGTALSPPRKFDITSVTNTTSLCHRITTPLRFTKHHHAIGFNHKAKVATG